MPLLKLCTCAVLWCVIHTSSLASSSDDVWQRRLNQSFSNAVGQTIPSKHDTGGEHTPFRNASAPFIQAPLIHPTPTTEIQSVQHARFEFLSDALRRQDSIVRPWQYGWTGAYVAASLKSLHSRNTAETHSEFVKSNLNLGSSLLALGAQISKDRYPGLNNSLVQSRHTLTEQINAAERLLHTRAQHTHKLHSFNDKLITYGISALTSALMWDKVGEKDAIANFGLSVIGIETSRRSLSNQAILDWNTYQTMDFKDHTQPLRHLTQHTKQLQFAINPLNTRVNLQYRF